MSEQVIERKSTYTSKQLSALLNDEKSLVQALEKDPKFVMQQDENGQTILHHAAALGSSLSHYIPDIERIGSILFKNPYLNFNIQDKNGNTPLHIAFYDSTYENACRAVIPMFLLEAQKRKSNFELFNKEGLSIYHLAALLDTAKIYFLGGKYSLIDMIKETVEKPNWNQFSGQGATPFYGALLNLFERNVDNVDKLFELGVDPLLYGSEKYSPVQFIGLMLNDIKKRSLNPQHKAEEEYLNSLKIRCVEICEKMNVASTIQETIKPSVSSEFPMNMVLSYFFSKPESKGAAEVELNASSSTTTVEQDASAQGEDDFELVITQ